MNIKKRHQEHRTITLLLMTCILSVTLISCDKAEISLVDSSASISEISNSNAVQQNSQINNNQSSISNVAQSTISNDTSIQITDINDFEKLGLSKEDYRYNLLKDFLSGDTTALEKTCCLQAGVFDAYKTLKIGKYSISFINDYEIAITFRILESGLDTLPVGTHTYIADVGDSVCFTPIRNANSGFTPAQEALDKWMSLGGGMRFFNVNTIDATQLEQFNYSICDYILYSYGDLNLEQFQEYALKLFDIKNFKPSMDPTNGIYTIRARGGVVHSYSYINETESNGIKTVTAQFYADMGKTIKSDTIEYKMQRIDGCWKFLSYNIIYDSPFEPMSYAV